MTDYADKIAAGLIRHTYRENLPHDTQVLLREIAAHAAREGYALGLGVNH